MATLRGSCSCGRNQYFIHLPEDVNSHASIYFDSSRDNRRSQGAPLTAWLRVPLGWFQSYTQSYFPDESHALIRRTFTPHYAPATKRIFCGFCGSPLTYWTEKPQDEAEFMSVSIGTLFGEDQRLLEDLNLLPEDLEDEPVAAQVAEHRTGSSSSAVAVVIPSTQPSPRLSRTYRSGTVAGIPWFEEMVEGSRLGRLLRTRRGAGISEDQSTTIEWEVGEWHEEGAAGLPHSASSASTAGSGKRRREE